MLPICTFVKYSPSPLSRSLQFPGILHMSGYNARHTPVRGAGEMGICMCMRMARLEEFQLPFSFFIAQHKCYLSESAPTIYSELSSFSHIFTFLAKSKT